MLAPLTLETFRASPVICLAHFIRTVFMNDWSISDLENTWCRMSPKGDDGDFYSCVNDALPLLLLALRS